MNKIDTIIDKLTPCLIEVSTDKILPTVFSVAKQDELEGLPDKGWLFDWSASDLRTKNVYKLLIQGDDTIQGLIATEVVRGAVHVHLTESATHNLGKDKQYEGVGGHLFAIAMRLSMVMGFGGYIFFDAKNMELVNHYMSKLGATRVPTSVHIYRMEVLESNAAKIIEKYTMEGDLNVV
jgi:hypothetical protein